MNEREIYRLVSHYYGKKSIYVGTRPNEKTITFLLYDEFKFYLRCGENSYDIRLARRDDIFIDTFLNKRCCGTLDEASIKEGLDQVDNYCRLLLPDKFLQAYEKAVGI